MSVFFVNAGDRIEEQKAIDPFVCSVVDEFDGLSVHQLYYDTLMFKIDEDFSLADMEAVVIRFEDYRAERSDVDFIKRIKFLDQNVHDILIPRVGACTIEFVRWNDSKHFDTLNIYSLDSEKYPYLDEIFILSEFD